MVSRLFTSLAGALRRERPDDEALARALTRHQQELEALVAERDQLGAALATMADGIVIVDGALRVRRVNDAAARILRLNGDPSAAVGRTLAEVVRDHELQAILTTALQQDAPHAGAVRYHLPGTAEEVRFIRATGVPLDGGRPGGQRGGLLVLQDVTELRRTETVRREFVGNVSHELRTPLASLKALVETLEEGALEDPPAAREFLAQMHVEVDSLTQLVQELLELSRIESGQAPLRPEAVPPAGLMEEACKRLLRQAERAGLSLTVEAPDDLPYVWADPALVERVLINLVHNAVKFTPNGGSVTVSAEAQPDAVVFTVRDSGIGITPEQLPRIFERFFKADRSRASRGTGLGLAIAKHIVQAHGGRIWAESGGEAMGSAFRFQLPLAPAGAQPRAPEPDDSAGDSAGEPTGDSAGEPEAAAPRGP